MSQGSSHGLILSGLQSDQDLFKLLPCGTIIHKHKKRGTKPAFQGHPASIL